MVVFELWDIRPHPVPDSNNQTSRAEPLLPPGNSRISRLYLEPAAPCSSLWLKINSTFLVVYTHHTPFINLLLIFTTPSKKPTKMSGPSANEPAPLGQSTAATDISQKEATYLPPSDLVEKYAKGIQRYSPAEPHKSFTDKSGKNPHLIKSIDS
jgi:hypothetical protein